MSRDGLTGPRLIKSIRNISILILWTATEHNACDMGSSVKNWKKGNAWDEKRWWWTRSVGGNRRWNDLSSVTD